MSEREKPPESAIIDPADHARILREMTGYDPGADPGDATFDAAVCCVSVDYLVRPVEVFRDVARVLRPGSPFVCTFSNRCFPTKAIRGWLATDDAGHCEIVARYFRLAGGWDEPIVSQRTPPGRFGDPLYAVWARRR